MMSPEFLRLSLPSIPQHVIQRGNNRQACFYADDDYKAHSYFLGLMKKENDANLRRALRQATQIGERKFLSAGTNLYIKSRK